MLVAVILQIYKHSELVYSNKTVLIIVYKNHFDTDLSIAFVARLPFGTIFKIVMTTVFTSLPFITITPDGN